MAWTEEILEAAYTSPSGKRQVFLYENVSRETELKTATFIFPELDGALVQSLGTGARTFPLKCIFAGEDCIKKASEFEVLLCERGRGVLEHPVYGRLDVVPTGTIKRSDNIKDGANEAAVEVVFCETLIDSRDGSSSIATEDSLNAAMDAYEEAAVADFESKIETGSMKEKMALQGTLTSHSNSILKGVEKMARAAKEKKESLKFLKDAKNFIRTASDTAAKMEVQALSLARTIIKTVRLPSKLAIGALAKIEGYATIIRDITNNVKNDPVGIKAIKNQYAATNLALGSLMTSLGFGVAESARAGEFKSRAAALEARARVSSLMDEYTAYIDAQNKKNAFVDTGESYDKILAVMTLSQKTIEQEALNLPATRTLTLGQDRQLLELLTELYGEDAQARQDEFIMENKLTADEIMLLPMGREVVYYA